MIETLITKWVQLANTPCGFTVLALAIIHPPDWESQACRKSYGRRMVRRYGVIICSKKWVCLLKRIGGKFKVQKYRLDSAPYGGGGTYHNDQGEMCCQQTSVPTKQIVPSWSVCQDISGYLVYLSRLTQKCRSVCLFSLAQTVGIRWVYGSSTGQVKSFGGGV